MNRIVILGGGFAGAYCAQALERRLPSASARVLLVDRNNYFVFYPLLVEAGTGSLEPRHAVVALRAFLHNSDFLMAETTGVDLSRRKVLCRVSGEEATRELPFDHLVLALGSVTRLPPVPGLDRYGLEMKSLTDAVHLRDRAIRMLEQADASEDPLRRKALLHFVVVGANFTGVEVAGELQVFLRGACRHYRAALRDQILITLVERSDRILPALDADLAEYAARRLRRRGIVLRLESTLTDIRADRVTFSDGESLPAQTVIWCAGIQPHPLLARLPFPLNPQGYLICERDLRVRGQENVWAIGDCATIPDPGGAPYPPTAQHAVREGAHLARNLASALRGEPLTPFVYASKGSLVPLGCRTGVAKVFGVKLSGFPAYFLWRLYYWMRMPGWARKFRVALDWTADLFFSRDVVQLGVHRVPPRNDS